MGSVYTVGQINGYIKNMFTQDFVLNKVSISGEISNLKYHSLGHIYFTLKDSDGTLSAMMFASNRLTGLKFRMQNGNKVVVSGNINIYEKDGTYRLYAKKIELAGDGELYLQFEKLKRELEEMGMFATEYKKPIKKFNQNIGIVTAKTGAAIQDIINISTRRNPYVQLYLYPAIVQGEYAKNSIVNGIRALDKMNLDVIIVGRGGGSFEDLFAFNEEEVARAIFSCNTPVISAVGHETDFTIADFVADLRAPTPSAAAEIAVMDVSILESCLEEYNNNLNSLISNKIYKAKNELELRRQKLMYLSPSNMLNGKRIYVKSLSEQLNYIMKNKIEQRRSELIILSERLNGLSPLQKLSEGYAVVENLTGDIISSVADVDKDDKLKLHLLDGDLEVTVDNKYSVKRSK